MRTSTGRLEETTVTDDELDALELAEDEQRLVPASDFFDFVEAHRIELA
ncbi:MAG: hypothetical protein ACRDLO_02190 [Solirubrobacterales bacterium]